MQTGYPFDRDSDRDGYLRSQLDDIAKRHPEIAEHLENFTQRDRQRRRPSTEEAGSPRRFPRQFGDRFERFGFPFDRDEFEPEYYTQFEQPQQHSTYQQSPPEHPDNPSTYSPSSPNQSCPQTSNTDRCNLQQSSTFDLGQKQEPVNDRGQRSMSAPPTENTTSNQPQQTENMSQSHSHSETKSSNERIIPIHIEGRDEPVMPKNVPPSYSQHHASQPQPERLFGKPTEHFTQFLPHERDARFANNWNQGFATEEPIRQQRFQPQYTPQKKTQEYVPSQPKDIPIPVHREVPVKHPEHSHQQSHPQPQQHQNQQQRSASPQVPPEPPKVTPHKPLTPLDQIQAIQKDVSSLMQQVEAFTGKSKDKHYLYLDEMLTRNLIKLDNIDTQGQESIRSARKEAIKCIEKTIGILEAKAAAGSDVPKECADNPNETSDVPEESNQFLKENSEVSKEMEVDEKTVENKVPANCTSGQLTEEKIVEPMDTELCPSQPSGDVQESMEVSNPCAGPVVTTPETVKKNDNIEATPDLESGSIEKKESELKGLEETATAIKEGPASEVKMLEDNALPDSKVITENLIKQSEEHNVKDQVPENPPTTVETVQCEAKDNELEEKKEKKDKKKGKKKADKKEK